MQLPAQDPRESSEFRGRLGAFGQFVFGNLWDYYGIIMGVLWEYYGIIMGLLSEYYGIIMGLLWDYYGIILGLLEASWYYSERYGIFKEMNWYGMTLWDYYGTMMGKPSNIEDFMGTFLRGNLNWKPWFLITSNDEGILIFSHKPIQPYKESVSQNV